MIVSKSCDCGSIKFKTNRIIKGDKKYSEHFCSRCGVRLNLKNGELSPFKGWYNISFYNTWYFSEDRLNDDSTQSRIELYEKMADRNKYKATIIFDRK
jgi:hypothetical protein